MPRHAISAVVLACFVLFLLAGCAGGEERSATGGDPATTAASSEPIRSVSEGSTGSGSTGSGSTGSVSETTSSVDIEQLSSGSDGLRRRQVILASSAATLSEATGVRVPDTSEGTHLAVFWGEKPTGGYTLEVLSARTEGSRVVVRLALEDPPPDAMVSQALTYPYAAAVLRGVDPGEKEFVFVTRNGREIGWPVRNV